MALIQLGSVSGTSAVQLSFSSSVSPPLTTKASLSFQPEKKGWRNRRMICRAMVQEEAVQGIPLVYAREMERLSAKESLILAFNDAGGFEALVTGKITDVQRIDVNERITSLERLNPTPRPTTSPYLEGRWSFEWFGSNTPGQLATRVIFERFPSALVSLSTMDIVIKDNNTKATANIKLLNSIENKIILSSKLTIEGPLRMKEEYLEGILESPTVIEEAVPEQLRGLLGQASTTLQQLPQPIKDTLANGLRIPLGGTYQRFFMISYLDDEILIIRDTAGVPEVLTRVETSSSSSVVENLEYNS
ncbi:PREDICTED: probable plastid-lipid-associated protein 9, chloroplastic [Camelina sativa]|uniref:Probable plastid-lipid-associated protein 9, chloroplastic n=1 Tax=Camelina sativa TaxID=90675 RepID=A0ABM0YR95_CAMSA|nr:PREDICTED: probable plastid-lipid-associated protein 9, chloroplastic [Camelina sativa]